VWMDQHPLDLNRRYLLKHTSRTVPAYVSAIEHRANISTLTREPADILEMNSIGGVSLSLLQPIAVDLYRENRATGALILIDPATNGTIAAGMITAASNDPSRIALGQVTAQERSGRWGHRGAMLELTGPAYAVDQIERSLFNLGAITARVEPTGSNYGRVAAIQFMLDAGLIVLSITLTDGATLHARSGEHYIDVAINDPQILTSAVHQLLTHAGVFVSSGKAGLQ
jgi:hypothetical protein